MLWAQSVFDTATLLLDGDGVCHANAAAQALAARAFPTRAAPPADALLELLPDDVWTQALRDGRWRGSAFAADGALVVDVAAYAGAHDGRASASRFWETARTATKHRSGTGGAPLSGWAGA